MRYIAQILMLVALAATLPGLLIAVADEFRPMPFHELAERVTDRYRGRLVSAQAQRPTPAERDLGAELVFELRLVTPERNLLRIRMDARSGRFLEIAGRGQLQAQRPGWGDDDDDHKDSD